MKWIYLSPHFDDVAFSCGGLVWEQAQRGLPVCVWTICGGDPPAGQLSTFARSLHARWQTGDAFLQERREEDVTSCRVMGADYLHFSIPDCIYRRGGPDNLPLYASEEAIFGELHPQEAGLVEKLSREIEMQLARDSRLVCPLALGGHVDHRLTRAAVEKLGREVWYYADYPYACQDASGLEALATSGWRVTVFHLSEAGVEAWVGAVAAHASQISTFWPGRAAMQAEIRAYARRMGGIHLWRKP